MESLHIPRGLGSLVVVLVTIGGLIVMAYALVERVDQFGADWESYRKPLKSAVDAISRKAASVEAHVSEIAPADKSGKPQQVVAVAESHTVRDAMLSRLSSLSEFLLAAAFVPFLVFFMLAAKRQVWHATMQLFPSTQRTDVKEALTDVTLVLRSYVIGTALVGLVLIVTSWLFFWGMGLDFPFLVALVSGLCNLIPYLGVMLSWIPPLLVGLKQFHTIGPFLWIFSLLTVFHIVAANLLDSRASGLARSAECTRADALAPFLGLALGTDGADSRDPHHRGDQGDLRPRGRLAARRPLAQRLAPTVRTCSAPPAIPTVAASRLSRAVLLPSPLLETFESPRFPRLPLACIPRAFSSFTPPIAITGILTDAANLFEPR